MASMRPRLVSSRQRHRYQRKQAEKLARVKAERTREGLITDVMTGVTQTLRANRTGTDATQVGMEALGKISSLMAEEQALKRRGPRRDNLPPMESPPPSPVKDGRLSTTFPGPEKTPTRPAAKFRATNSPLYGRDARFKTQTRSLSPNRNPRSAWDSPATHSPLAPVAMPTDLTRPASRGDRKHYVLTRRMKPSLLKPLPGTGGRRRRKHRGAYSVSPPRFTGPPRRLQLTQALPAEPVPESSSPPGSSRHQAPAEPRPATAKAATPREVAPAPRVTIKRAVLRLGGEHVLVRVSGNAAGDAGQQWPVTVTVTNASGDLLGQDEFSQAQLSTLAGFDVPSPSILASNLVVLRASTIGACPSLRSSSLRCCRVIGGRRALIKIQSTAGEVTAEVVEVSSGQQTVLKMPTEDAGWLLREPCSSVRGLSRQQLARLAGLITTQGGATLFRRTIFKNATPAVSGAATSRTLLSVSMQLPSACGGLACVFRGVCLTQRWAGELQLPLHQFTVDVDPSGSGLADALHSAARMLEWAHEDGDVSLRLSL